MTESTILHFISQFAAARETFLGGCCYWFAVILRERFEAEIYYDPIENHFVGKIGRQFYDVTGTLPDNGRYIPWETYKDTDEAHYNRLVRDCINKET